jgi:gliding motility-associated-like protein
MYRLIVQFKLLIIALLITCFSGQIVFSQTYSSRNNYTGDWEQSSSWNPVWTVPQTSILGGIISINGYITVNGSLSFYGSASKLIINDTLVIKGNLTLGDNNDLTINDNGILIIRGSFSLGNQTIITANGYLVIESDIIKNSSIIQGSITSNNNPVKLFLGGTIPAELTENNTLYPATDCTSPLTTRYPASNCSYGNMTDLLNDPIYSFFQTTCLVPQPDITSTGDTSFCDGGSITLTSSQGSSYLWSTGATTDNINITTTGIYSVKVTNAAGCLSASSDGITITVNPLPAIPIITASGPLTFCSGDSVTLTSSSAAGYLWSNGSTSQGIDVKTGDQYSVQVINTYGCQSASSAPAEVIVNKSPVAVPGPDQELKFTFETQMNAELSASETGEWSLVSGSAHIIDIYSPTTRITGLGIGENRFRWNVRNSKCETTGEVKITVSDQFVPSVITPNGDGKNDFFKINEYTGKVQLIIINRWGNEEYSNSDYSNDWDGRNNKGIELPADTYFYILKFDNGKVLKGSVLVKR